MKKVQIFDSTLRDGAQGENVNFSVEDKFNVMKALDDFGIDFIEAGNPASNPKDMEFFKRAEEHPPKHAKLVAFGSTRRKNVSCEEDANLNALANTNVDYVSVFGKSWDMHATEILGTTLEENLNMISDTIKYLVSKGKKVFFDAEHFFDGYKRNPEYALETLKTAEKAGAEAVVLCDTNGGCFPDEISEITAKSVSTVTIPVGIHCHNDTGCAVANSVAAVKAGASQVQGTLTGIGERCGNTNLSTVIANLQLKLRMECVPETSPANLTQLARYIAEVCNMKLTGTMPYVGTSAFSHKGGMHADGVNKNPISFEHIPPESVGNKRNILLSEVAGRSAILRRINDIAPELNKDSFETKAIIDLLKEMEFRGYQYEAAEASFELLVKKYLGKTEDYFGINYFKIIGEKSGGFQNPSSAMVKVSVKGQTEMAAAEGDGPVNAIDKAIRQALTVFYPSIADIHLIDYKVRVVDGSAATAANVRVLIESTDGKDIWTTVGASTDIINASVTALIDSLEYKLVKDSSDSQQNS
ncbi:MAG: citramalate synthase [Oscillospiraceae bacterium]|nr:citramalate synthase [Oscillospiraceae bacterium]